MFRPASGAGKGILFELGGATIQYTPDQSFDITEWHHYAASYDGNKISLYIDGQEVNSSALSGVTINTDDTPLRIGTKPAASYEGDNSYLNAEIDEVRIWDTGRTQTQIEANMNTQFTGNESGLFAYYSFDDETATDATGNNNGQIITEVPEPSDEIAHWSLGDATGTTAQNQGTIGNAVNATYLGNPDSTSSLVSSGDDAKDFDGIDDGLHIDNHVDINSGTSYTEKTIELYFRADSVGGRQMLYEEGGTVNGLNIYLDNNRLKFGVWANYTGKFIEPNLTINPHETYQVALTFDQGILRAFINGQFAGGVETGFNEIPGDPGAIGIAQVKGDTRLFPDINSLSVAFTGDGLHFDGVIDEVKLYDTALTGSQIQAHLKQFNTLDYEIPHEPTVDVFLENKLPTVDFGKNTNVIIGDFNGDGKDDILRQSDQLGYEVFLSYGINGFAPEQVISVNSATTDTKKDNVNIHVGDFNGDGKDDFIAQYIGDTFDSHLFTSNGDGTFTQTTLPAWYYIRGDLVNLIIGDFNGDGKDDFIRQEKGAWDDDNQGTADIYLSNGDGTFSGQPLTGNIYDIYGNASAFDNDWLKGDLTNLIVGDFNGDGTDDLIRQEKGEWDDDGSGTAHIMLFDGSAIFTSALLTDFDSMKGDLTNLIVGDFNGDGQDDFIRQEKGAWDDDNSSSTAQVYFSNGSNFFLPSFSDLGDLKGDENNIIVGDFNGDGKDDFALQSKSGGEENVIYFSAGNGQFFPDSITNNYSGDASTMLVADFNSDGKDEIILNGYNDVTSLLTGETILRVPSYDASVFGSDLTSDYKALNEIAFDINEIVQNDPNPSSPFNKNLIYWSSANTLYGKLGSIAVKAIPGSWTTLKPVLKSGVNASGHALELGGELASVLLAKTGNSELATYFGSGSNPFIDVGEFGDGFFNDAGEVVAQTLVNIVTSPIETFLDIFALFSISNYEFPTFSGLPNYGDYQNPINYYYDINTSNGGDYGYQKEYISLRATNHNDFIKARLYAEGQDGDDIIVGRLNTNDDVFLTHVSNLTGPHPYADDYDYYDPQYQSRYDQFRDELFKGSTRLRLQNILSAQYYPDPTQSVLDGGNGNDILISRVTANLLGGNGDDYIRTTYYTSNIQGGAGNDVIYLEYNSEDTAFNLTTVNGGTEDDHLIFTSPLTGSVTIDLLNTSIQFNGQSNNLTISEIEKISLIGTDNNDTIDTRSYSDNTTSVYLQGGDGNDTLLGSATINVMDGGEGDDSLTAGTGELNVLTGGKGFDTLTGNTGTDTFVINTNKTADGHDVINNFDLSQGDTVLIDTLAFGNLYQSDLNRFSVQQNSTSNATEIHFDNSLIATVNEMANQQINFGNGIEFVNYSLPFPYYLESSGTLYDGIVNAY